MVKVRKRDLLNIFFRSFFIQSSWNYERMIGLGFCFCIIPIARRLFDKEQDRIEFLQRHLDFFNSHPYLVTYALGAVANIEQQAISKQWTDKRPLSVFKTRIIGPLGIIGDTLFWQLIKPASGLLGVVFLMLFGYWGIVPFLITYNIPHIYARARGLIKSYIKGFDIVRDLSLRGTKKYFDIIKYSISALLSINFVIIMNKIYVEPFYWKGLFIFIISTFISYFVVRRQKISTDLLIVIVICSSIIIGLIIL